MYLYHLISIDLQSSRSRNSTALQSLHISNGNHLYPRIWTILESSRSGLWAINSSSVYIVLATSCAVPFLGTFGRLMATAVPSQRGACLTQEWTVNEVPWPSRLPIVRSPKWLIPETCTALRIPAFVSHFGLCSDSPSFLVPVKKLHRLVLDSMAGAGVSFSLADKTSTRG